MDYGVFNRGLVLTGTVTSWTRMEANFADKVIVSSVVEQYDSPGSCLKAVSHQPMVES